MELNVETYLLLDVELVADVERRGNAVSCEIVSATHEGVNVLPLLSERSIDTLKEEIIHNYDIEAGLA